MVRPKNLNFLIKKFQFWRHYQKVFDSELHQEIASKPFEASNEYLYLFITLYEEILLITEPVLMWNTSENAFCI